MNKKLIQCIFFLMPFIYSSFLFYERGNAEENISTHANTSIMESDSYNNYDPFSNTFYSSPIANGTFGTSPWYITPEGTLHLEVGELGRVSLDGSPWKNYSDVINEIILDGPIKANTNSFGLFRDLPNVTSIQNLNLLDISETTDLSFMFQGASSLTDIDVSSWDTSKVTTMWGMFDKAKSLVHINVKKWDTSKVAIFHSMFRDASSLNSLDTSAWDTSNSKDMSFMFEHTALTDLDVSKWDTSKVKDMFSMFKNSSALTKLDVSKWDTSKVKDMSFMFHNTRSLPDIDVSKWDTSNVTDMSHLFQKTAFTNVDISKWNTSKVKDMSYMFQDTALTDADVSKWDTSNVTDMGHMFHHSLFLTHLDLSKWNTLNVSYMSSMFSDTSSLSQLQLGNDFKWDTSVHLPKIIQNNQYTGKWINVGDGDIHNPTGTNKWTSDEFTNRYNRTKDGDTYVWEKKKALDVTIHYIDRIGAPISPDTILTGNIGDIKTIDIPDVTGYSFQKFINIGNDGKVIFDNSVEHVFVVYTKDPVAASDITVHYQDKNGTTISPDTTLTGNIGEEKIIDIPSINGYFFKEFKNIGSDGKVIFDNSISEVTLVYMEFPRPTRTVTIHYQDIDGNTISPDTTLSGKVGDSKTVDVPMLPDYSFKEFRNIGNDGQLVFDATIQEVFVIYQKDVSATTEVVIHFHDSEGNPLSPSTTISGNIGDRKKVETPTLPGYTFKKFKNIGNDGHLVFDSTIQEAFVIYTKDASATTTVTIHYQDSEGNTLSPDTTLSGKVGETKNVEVPVISGFTFKEFRNVGNDGQLVFDSTIQEAFVIYTKDASVTTTVTIHYQDSEGNTLSPASTLSGKVGETKNVEVPVISGFTFKEFRNVGNDGQLILDPDVQEVFLIYMKIPSTHTSITVHYQDSEGISIAPDATIAGNIGDTKTVNILDISGYIFSEFRNIGSDGQIVFDGSVQEIFLIYTKVPSSSIDISIHYQDSDGNTLSPDTILTGNLGETKTIETLAIPGYSFKEFRNVGSDGQLVVDGSVQDVFLIYTKIMDSPINITIHYQDNEGNTLSPDTILTGNLGDTKTIDILTISGYTFEEFRNMESNGQLILDDAIQEVFLIYSKLSNSPIDVSIHYQDGDGNTLSPDTILTGNLGETKTIDTLAIPGYSFKEFRNIGNDGQFIFDNAILEVFLIYTKIPSNLIDITIHYQDSKGNVLSPDTLVTGNYGDAKTIDIPTISGYSFKKFKNIASNGQLILDNSVDEVFIIYTKMTTTNIDNVTTVKISNHKNKQQLPQTGETHPSLVLILIGMTFLSFSGIGYLKRQSLQ